MSYVDFTTPAIEMARQAASLDEAQKYKEALDLYMKSIDHFMTAIKYETKNPKKRDLLRDKVKDIMERAEQIKEFLKSEDSTSGDPNSGVTKDKKKQKDDKESEKDKEKKEFQNALSGAIVREKPNVKWTDVAGLDQAKEALKEAVVLPIKFPQLFVGKREPWKGILLYGPPGTGKSYLAKAVATECASTFFSVSSADLVSKWQGESEKLVRTLFEMARESKPSIIFIDEIDSLASTRSDGDNESTRRIKTEFLVQMQGVGNNSSGVLVLSATNLPWGLDPAVRRRFERRIYIPLPEENARTDMFQIHLGNTPHSCTKEDFRELAKLTEFFSGSDISILVRSALMEPVRTCQLATHFKKVKGQCPREPNKTVDDLLTPCSPGDPEAIEMTLEDVPGEKLYPPVVSKYDFIKALKSSKPSVGKDDLAQYEKFTKEFGQDGNM
jgi:vacuolar protein-sorting-associated protein 4